MTGRRQALTLYPKLEVRVVSGDDRRQALTLPLYPELEVRAASGDGASSGPYLTTVP